LEHEYKQQASEKRERRCLQKRKIAHRHEFSAILVRPKVFSVAIIWWGVRPVPLPQDMPLSSFNVGFVESRFVNYFGDVLGVMVVVDA
jgi:hypothetical protein